MRTEVAWSDRVPERDGVTPCVYDMAFRPDGSQIVCAVGSRVLVYNAADGQLLHSLKGHKDTLYCVAYSRDGKRFASGGADKTIIIWTAKAEGILKYSHNDSVQCLSYNSVTQQLASATATDFGLWSPEQKSVAKHKVPSRVMCMSWTNDGTCLALGHFTGQISLRDKSGVERLAIQRNAPVWAIQWNPSRDESQDLLAVACWDQTLSFYELSGMQHGNDRQLGFDPCCVRHFSNGEYLCIGGSDRKASLWTKDGVRLTPIAERDEWVWCCVPRPNHNYVVVGCNDGSITMYQLIFATVHGLYRERYAFREYMTDVVVQQLATEQKVRIKCKNYVKKIAIYKDRLAVLLPERLHIYELPPEDASSELAPRLRDKIALKSECSQLLILSSHFVVCNGKRLMLHAFSGGREREWQFEAAVRYIKPIGGPPSREGMLVGLDDGEVYEVFLNNDFPISIVKHGKCIRCLDISASRRKLAVVDDEACLTVYDMATGAVAFKEADASSVAWNNDVDDMLAFSHNGTLSIKTAGFPLHQQRQRGVVVGFKGSKIFCLHYVNMQAVDVPQSASLYRYLEVKDFEAAHAIACLGVTNDDWRELGMEALKALSFDVARRAFVRLKDVRWIDLIRSLEERKKQPGTDDAVLTGTVMAYAGKFQEAAKLFNKANRADLAIEMFTDLRRWDEARAYSHGAADTGAAAELMQKQAAWAAEVDNPSVAAETYLAAGDTLKAIGILGEQGWLDKLHEVARKLGKSATDELRACLGWFEKHGATERAREVLLKMGDVGGIISLHVSNGQWADALALAKEHPQFAAQVHLPYAQWLVEQDRFDEAQAAFRQAGQAERCVAMLQTLTHNAVLERRFEAAGHSLWLLARESLIAASPTSPSPTRAAPNGHGFGSAPLFNAPPPARGPPPEAVDKFWRYRRMADQYYAYQSIHKYTDDPFTALSSDTVFCIARYLLSWLLKDEVPFGISKAYCIYALAKQSKALGANKLARFALEKLAQYRVPVTWQDQVDLFALSIRSRPPVDSEELLPSCFRCQTINPLLNQGGDRCIACHHQFVRSFSSFEVLPLVRFTQPRGMSLEEALTYIRRDAPPRPSAKRAPANPWRDSEGPDVNVLSLAGDADQAAEGGIDIDDPFTKAMLDFEPGPHFSPPVADSQMLLAMDKADVFAVTWPVAGMPAELYRNMMPDVPIVLCTACNHFFLEDDWELAVMQKKACPFCKVTVNSDYSNGCAAAHPPPPAAG